MNTAIRLSLDKTERLFAFPYPLKVLGYYPGVISSEEQQPMKDQSYLFRNEFQFSLRLTGPVEKIRNNINGEEYENTFPHVIFKCPGHKYQNDFPFPSLNSLCIHYDREKFQPFFDAHFSKGPFAWDVKLTPQITALVHEIMEKLRISQNYSIADKLDLLAFQLIEELMLFRFNSEGCPGHNEKRQRVQNIASYIKINFRSNIDLDEQLAANHISRATFFRHWNALYNESPQQFQMNLRIQAAEQLLADNAYTIRLIAEWLGFSSAAYFCAIFKKYKGCSPAEYARRNSQIELDDL